MGMGCKDVAEDLKRCCVKLNPSNEKVILRACVTNTGQEDECKVRAYL
jgi:hypothetical protein